MLLELKTGALSKTGPGTSRSTVGKKRNERERRKESWFGQLARKSRMLSMTNTRKLNVPLKSVGLEKQAFVTTPHVITSIGGLAIVSVTLVSVCVCDFSSYQSKFNGCFRDKHEMYKTETRGF